MITRFIAKFDKFLYKYIGIVTPLRRAYWRRTAIDIQKELTRQHGIRDFVNENGYNVTTKEALIKYEEIWDRMNENEDGTDSPSSSLLSN